jgi:hypothetical protein
MSGCGAEFALPGATILIRNTARSDKELIARLQRGTFNYFLRQTNPANGLVADTTRPGAPASIAVVGFALSSYPVAVERGWITRAEAEARIVNTLRFSYKVRRMTGQMRPVTKAFTITS